MKQEGKFRSLFKAVEKDPGQADPQEDLTRMGRVVPDANRCVQCGICSYNCPVGVPVRDYAQRGFPVDDSRCLTCGNCINVCPRGTLRWETQAHSLILDRFLLSVTAENE
jgi:ferredoxin